jgi:hypothetical protein
MFFFQRLFSAFYSILIRLRRIQFLRHMNRGGTEDFGAVCFVTLTQLYIVLFIVWILKKIIGFDTDIYNKNFLIAVKITGAILYGIVLYFNRNYFLKDRTTRNTFIDSFRELNISKRRVWNIFGLILILLPLLVFGIYYMLR